MSLDNLLAALHRLDVQLWLEDGSLCYTAPPSALSPELRGEIAQHRDELIRLLAVEPPHVRYDQTIREFPMSFVQERMWFLDRLLAENDGAARAAFNNPLALELIGPLSVSTLRASLCEVVRRHDVLRASLTESDVGAIQIIEEPFDPDLRLFDISGVPVDLREHERRRIVTAEVHEPFDLAGGRLLRCALVRLDAARHLLLLVLHHAVSDGWSMEILSRELATLYGAFLDGAPSPLQPLASSYGDYALWQRKMVSGERAASQRRYWIDRLSGAPWTVSLPTDRPRPHEQSYRTRSVDVELPDAHVHRLRAVAVQERTTLFATLLAPFAALIARYGEHDDVLIGTPVANRRTADAEELVGCFVNPLVLRVGISREETARTLLGRVRDAVLDAQAAQDLPFEDVVAALQPARTFSHSPLFQLMFALQFAEQPAITAGRLKWTSVDVATELSPYDLTVFLRQTPVGLRGTIRYATDLFDLDRIQRLAAHYHHLLRVFPDELDTPVGRLSFIGAEERASISAFSLGPSSDGDVDLISAIRAHADLRPSTVAVCCGAEVLTYRELDLRSARLGRIIHDEVGVRGGIVAVAPNRSVNLVVALVGVLRSGSAYLPLDAAYPEHRLRNMLDDSRAEIVVCDERSEPFWSEFGRRVVPVDSPTDSKAVDIAIGRPEDLAYVTYTSGSTGRPKGVAVTRGALWNVLADMHRRLQVDEADRFLALTSISFDISALELFLPLLCGGRIVVVDRDTARDPDALGDAIEQNRCTVAQATPSTWRMLIDSGWRRPAGLRVLCGGEPLGSDVCRALLTGGDGVWNLYGPTEATIWATAAWITDAEDVSLGRPISNTTAYVLDDHLDLVPFGVAGELFLGGAGLARGYFSRPDLTAERFLPDPMGHGGRLYRTGDLVRRRSDGNLEYIDRLDRQCKIRGHRIELGELEACLLDDPTIKDAVVVPVDDGSEGAGACLAAFVTPNGARKTALDFSLFYFAASQSSDDNARTRRDPYELYVKSAQAADQAGFLAVWTPERHFHEVGALYPNPSVLTAALATVTTHIQLRAGSVVLPLHDPIRVAEEWSVVDNLSGGRAGVAFASGWNEADFALFPERYATRREVMWQQIDTVRRLWRGEEIQITDGRGARRPVRIMPRPVQPELPMWITAGGSPATFEAAGREGAHVLTHLLGQTLEELEEKIDRYRDAREAYGHGRRSGRVTLMLHAFVWDTAESAEAIARQPFREYLRAHISLEQIGRGSGVHPSLCGALTADEVNEILDIAVDRYLHTASLIGDIESCVQIANRLRQIGVDEVACLMDFGISDDLVLQSLDYLRVVKDRCRRLSAVEVSDLLGRLRSRLPDYMVPASVTVLECLPLTPAGKLDRQQLARRSPTTEAIAAPRTGGPLQGAIEHRVAAIWQELLRGTVSSPDDDFFRLGGHSLLAASFASRIRKEYGAPLPLKKLFEDPRLRAVCQVIAALTRTDDPGGDLVRSEHSRVPLSFQQERVWRIEHEGSPAAARNKVHAWSINGVLDVEALAQAADALVARHECLRSRTCVDGAGAPYQEVVTSLPRVMDVSAGSVERDLTFVQQWACDDLGRPFDLATVPIFRLKLFRTGTDKHVLVLSRHAMVMDGWSVDTFARELFAWYEACGRVDAKTMAPPPFQYADYCVWQRRLLRGAERDRLCRYWSATLAGASPLASVTPDRLRPARPSFAGAAVRRDLPPATRDGLLRMAHQQGVTLFMLLLLAYKLAIGARTGIDDLVVGTLVANRRRGDLEGMLGFFANTIPLRTQLQRTLSMMDALRAVRDTTLEAFEHQEMPIDEVAALLGWLPESTCRIVFVLHNQPAGPVRCGELTIRELPLPVVNTRYDLCLAVTETEKGLSAVLEYSTDLYDERTAAAILDEWAWLAEWVVRHPDATVGRAHAAVSAAASSDRAAAPSGAAIRRCQP